MSTFTLQEWIRVFLRYVGNLDPHPYVEKYIGAWAHIETRDPQRYALHNPLNTTQPGFGHWLLPLWNAIGVKQYPTMEDGAAAAAACLIGGPTFYYPTLFDCLRLNHGAPLQDATPEIQKELNIWSGNANYAHSIAIMASRGNVNLGLAFLGRKAGQV